MSKKKFIIISFDAVDGNDIDFLSKLPHFGKILKKSSYSKEVQTIYPSLTYPVHTSIITGMKPINHNITNNVKLQINKSQNPDWFWNKKEIKCDTLFDIAKRNKLICSSILWPVTCKAKIKYNMPEVFSNNKWQNQIITSALNGSIKYQMNLNNKFSSLRDGLNQPQLDNFAMTSFLYTLTEYSPDIIFLHLTDVDTNRHNFGYNSKEAEYALRRHDLRLGEVTTKLETLELLDHACIILLSDHSMKDVHSAIKLNKLFLNKCWLTLDKKNKFIESHEVFCNHCDGSAYIYLKDKSNTTLLNKVITELKDFSLKNNNCIKEILTSDEAKELGADPNCSLMLEANDGYYFLNDFNGEIIEKTLGKHHLATHGYNPNYYENKPFFIVSDNSVKQNFDMGAIKLLDIAPTIAKLMDDSMIDTDGRIISRIFK